MSHLLRTHKAQAPQKSGDSRGFTLVELLVVMIFATMFSGLIMSFFLDLWNSTATLQNDSETFVTREDAGDSLRDTFNAATSLINQNGIPDAHANVTDPNDSTGTYWLTLHAIPGTVTMPTTGFTPLLYFQSPSVNTSKQFIMNGAEPYQDNFVLYLDASTKKLLLRTIANPAAAGEKATTSCPPSLASASCPADKTVATDVSSVATRYFSRSGNLLDWTSIKDPITGLNIGPDFPSVEVLELTINLHRKATLHAGADTSNQTIIRVAFRNG